MSATLTPGKLLTAEEFATMPPPADGARQELVQGRIIALPPVQGIHGIVAAEIAFLLRTACGRGPARLGFVTCESGFIVQRDPDTVCGPDVAFWRATEQPDLPAGYFAVPAAIVAEVLSPEDRMPRVREKVREYVAAGVRLVWLVNPETRTVTVYAGSMRGLELDDAETLDGGDVLPGFACRVAEFFP